MEVVMRALFFLSLLACGSDKVDTGSGSVISDEDARAMDLWSDLDGYDTWEQHADWTGIVASSDGTHGDYVSIWMNDTAAATIHAEGGGDMPEGSIIVKEGYNDEAGADIKGVTVMLKEEGWGDDGWFWAKYDTDGSGGVQLAGAVSACAGCHAGGQDGVLFTSW
jgi:hypothetical protein